MFGGAEMREIVMRECEMGRAARMAAGTAMRRRMAMRWRRRRLGEARRCNQKRASGEQQGGAGKAFEGHGPPVQLSGSHTANPSWTAHEWKKAKKCTGRARPTPRVGKQISARILSMTRGFRRMRVRIPRNCAIEETNLSCAWCAKTLEVVPNVCARVQL
jgi:hypothetical protein